MAADTLKLYWRAVWGTEKNIAAQQGLVMSNDRMEKLLSEAHAAGGKAHALESERAGAIHFGQALREVIARWPDTDDPGRVRSVPVWDLERLLESWNVPADALDAIDIKPEGDV